MLGDAEKRRLLEECADLFIVCDDGTKIPCSRFHVSTRCTVLRWVCEDTERTREIPVPQMHSRTLCLALDVVHDLRTLDDMDLPEIVAAMEGLDVLGAAIDTAPRVWALVKNRSIYDVRPQLAQLMRSSVPRNDIVTQMVVLAPSIDNVIASVRSCEPDFDMALYLLTTLVKMYPASILVKELLRAVPRLTIDQAITLASVDAIGVYAHPMEVRLIMRHIQDGFKDPDSSHWKFIRNMASALHVYDTAPLSTSTFHGSVISFHDAQSVSALMVLDGKCPNRWINVARWLRLSLHEDSFAATIKARAIDSTAKKARCLDLRVMAETAGQRAEMLYTWSAPEWNPAMPASTLTCSKSLGDPLVFDSLVESGKFAKKMMLRVDVFFGDTSALDVPPLVCPEAQKVSVQTA